MNFWPFKRTPVVTMEEFVADRLMPVCGNKVAHYNLTAQGVTCFECAAIRKLKERHADEERLADLIATKVAQKLNREQKC